MSSLKYEMFLREAFSIKLDTSINRGDDIGGLAEADIFRLAERDNCYFSKVKIGTGYAISAFNNEILNNCKIKVTSTDENNMINLLNKVLSAQKTTDIINIIDEYKVYRDRYFKKII